MKNLFIFIDTIIIQLPEKETTLFIEDVKILIQKESDRMGLSLDDTSFAKYFRKEGMEEGEKRKAKDIALRMIKKNYEDSSIAQMTDLSLEEIKQLREDVER